MNNKLNPSISLIRVLAMISIILGHWLTMENINHYQFGAVGVEVFLFISGWLQSDKVISNYKKWGVQRCIRLLPPFWIGLLLITMIRLILRYNIEISSLFIYLFNLQGISKIFKDVSIQGIPGYGQTWFLTALMLCYVLMVVVKKIPIIENYILKNLKLTFILSILLQVGLSYFKIQISFILCFFYGCFWNKKCICTKKQYLILTSGMLISTFIRFLSHLFFDGTIAYDYIIFAWSFIILGVWITTSAMIFCKKKSAIITPIVQSKVWKKLDYASYPLFLTHYMFVSGDFSVNKWINNIFLHTLMFVFLTILSSMLVIKITELISANKR